MIPRFFYSAAVTLFLCSFFFAAATSASGVLTHVSQTFGSLNSKALSEWIESLQPQEGGINETVKIIEPLAGTVLPQDMASTAFVWDDPSSSKTWLVTIEAGERLLARAILDRPWWIPGPEIWEALKPLAPDRRLNVVIRGIGGWNGRIELSAGQTFFSFSRDKVEAWLMFMRKPLPFLKAKENPDMTSLLAGDLSAYDRPENLMADTGICVNCHSYSAKGRHMLLDMDYGGDKGGMVIQGMADRMVIGREHVFSWNVLEPAAPAEYSMGLFAGISPDGRYVAGTVNETSVFVMMDDVMFSQLFFPATGHIAIFDRTRNDFFLLAGADRRDRVQTSPAWCPEGKTIAFASAPTRPQLVEKVVSGVVRKETPEQTIDVLNKKYPVRFDIHTIAFNNGKGGNAEPLAGASGNGMSNYFPRYSPDGRWIVFTQSPTGLVLQPDSRLVIIPAGGGEPRVLKSNQPVMNSWHSWSPNSRWLVFTCKANSPYTELYLTHIDSHGNASPAIRLFRFSHNDLAAMVPEFIPKKASIPGVLELASPEQARGKSMATDGR